MSIQNKTVSCGGHWLRRFGKGLTFSPGFGKAEKGRVVIPGLLLTLKPGVEISLAAVGIQVRIAVTEPFNRRRFEVRG